MRRPTPRLALLLLLLSIVVSLSLAQDEGLPLYALPDARANTVQTSGSIALKRGGRIVIATNMLNNSVSIVDPLQGNLIAEIPVGDDPRTTAILPDDVRALVVNRGDGTLTLLNMDTSEVLATYPVGVLPYGVVTDDNEIAYVSLQGSSEVIELSVATGDILRRIHTPDDPTGLALWGDFLYVTHLWSGDLSLIYLPTGQVVRTISTGDATSLSQAIEIDTTTGLAYLPQSRSYADNPFLTYDNTILPVVNRVALRDLTLQPSARIGLDVADRPVNMPFALKLDTFRKWLYVVNAGSNSVSVIDLATGLARAHIPVGANPRGIVLTRDNAFAYVHNVIDGTLTIIETRNLTVTDVLPISDVSIPVAELIGAELFHSATDSRLATNNYISCASCHFDGQSDGRVWLGQNTPVLFDLAETAPYTWLGEWDELADLEIHIRRLQTGTGLVDQNGVTASALLANQSLDLDSLTTYLATFRGPDNPTKADSMSVERGSTVFAEQSCASCHSGSKFTDSLAYNVGTGGRFNTPSLLYLWMSAPYFHDGRAATLADVFRLPGDHQLLLQIPDGDIAALVDYLLSLP